MAKRIQKRKLKVNQFKTKYKNLLNKYKRVIKILKTKNGKEYKSNFKYCPKKIYLDYDRIQNPTKLRKDRKANKTNFDANKLKNL